MLHLVEIEKNRDENKDEDKDTRLTGNFDEMFDDLHSLHLILLSADFRHDPEHLTIHKLHNNNRKCSVP